jgi:hypothetical protein
MTRYSGNIIKKRRELLQLQLFKECFSSIADFEISIIENDPPDGLIKVGAKEISIELTQIFWDEDVDGVNKKAQENLADIIMDLAQMKYQRFNLPPLQVNVSFVDKYGLKKGNSNARLYPTDKEILSDYILEKVIKNLPISNEASIEIPEYNNRWERILNPKIHSIDVSRFPELTENCWAANGAGVIPLITFEKINETIQKKNIRLSNYENAYDENWLVIIEDWDGLSGYFNFRNAEELFKRNFESEFTRVFILRSGRKELIELNIAQ